MILYFILIICGRGSIYIIFLFCTACCKTDFKISLYFITAILHLSLTYILENYYSIFLRLICIRKYRIVILKIPSIEFLIIESLVFDLDNHIGTLIFAQLMTIKYIFVHSLYLAPSLSQKSKCLHGNKDWWLSSFFLLVSVE